MPLAWRVKEKLIMKNVKDLEIYNLALDLSVKIRKELWKFPEDEKYGLSSQLSRASVSVFSNIAEGYVCDSKKEFLKFLGYAYRSLKEVSSQLSYSFRVGYLRGDDYKKLKNDIFKLDRKMLRFIEYIKKDERFYK